MQPCARPGRRRSPPQLVSSYCSIAHCYFIATAESASVLIRYIYLAINVFCCQELRMQLMSTVHCKLLLHLTLYCCGGMYIHTGTGNNRSYDGYRQKQWCVSSAQYGVRWRARDVVGVYLDADLLEMRFFVNGQDLGTAFAGYQVLAIVLCT
jgi:SPRY domain